MTWRRSTGIVTAEGGRIDRITNFLTTRRILGIVEADDDAFESAHVAVALNREGLLAVVSDDGHAVVPGPTLADLAQELASDVNGEVIFGDLTCVGEHFEDPSTDPFSQPLGADIAFYADRAAVFTRATARGVVDIATQVQDAIVSVPHLDGHVLCITEGPILTSLEWGSDPRPAVLIEHGAATPSVTVIPALLAPPPDARSGTSPEPADPTGPADSELAASDPAPARADDSDPAAPDPGTPDPGAPDAETPDRGAPDLADTRPGSAVPAPAAPAPAGAAGRAPVEEDHAYSWGSQQIVTPTSEHQGTLTHAFVDARLGAGALVRDLMRVFPAAEPSRVRAALTGPGAGLPAFLDALDLPEGVGDFLGSEVEASDLPGGVEVFPHSFVRSVRRVVSEASNTVSERAEAMRTRAVAVRTRAETAFDAAEEFAEEVVLPVRQSWVNPALALAETALAILALRRARTSAGLAKGLLGTGGVLLLGDAVVNTVVAVAPLLRRAR